MAILQSWWGLTWSPGERIRTHQPQDTKVIPQISFLMWTENEKIQGAEMDTVTYLFLSHTLSQNMCPTALSKMTGPDRPFNLTSSLENMVGRGWGQRTSKKSSHVYNTQGNSRVKQEAKRVFQFPGNVCTLFGILFNKPTIKWHLSKQLKDCKYDGLLINSEF